MNLTVAMVQSELHWQDPVANRQQFDERFEALLGRGADLVILPEMFTTGFSMDSATLAEPADGPTVQWLRDWSRRLNAAVTGSVMTRDGERRVNRLWFATPDGCVHHYDKRHLFRMAGEHQHYAAGDATLVVEFRGWRIAPLVCYDLRFPVWSRRRPGFDYDLLLYVANWPARRSHAWRQLLVARAIENQSHVIGVNRIGTDGNGVAHDGDSAAYDHLGMPLAAPTAAPTAATAVATAVLDLAAQREFRDRFPAHLDADRFEFAPEVGAP